MLRPSVSVIIPAFNAADHIAQAIESVMAQCSEAKELICVNDGSTDNTLEIMERYQLRHPDKIRIISLPNGGAPAARNKGLSSSSGEYIQFLDADDMLLPDKLEHQVKLITASPAKPDMIASASYRINFRGEKKRILVNTHLWKGILSSSLGNTCANLFRREALIKAGGWNVELGSSQEYDLMFRIVKNEGKVIIDQEPKTIVKDRNNSISATNRDKNWERFIMLRSQVYDYLKQQSLAEAELKQFALQEIFNAIRILYTLNPSSAKKWYKEIMIPEKNFIPSATGATTPRYVVFFRFLGFPLTDYIFRLLK